MNAANELTIGKLTLIADADTPRTGVFSVIQGTEVLAEEAKLNGKAISTLNGKKTITRTTAYIHAAAEWLADIMRPTAEQEPEDVHAQDEPNTGAQTEQTADEFDPVDFLLNGGDLTDVPGFSEDQDMPGLETGDKEPEASVIDLDPSQVSTEDDVQQQSDDVQLPKTEEEKIAEDGPSEESKIDQSADSEQEHSKDYGSPTQAQAFIMRDVVRALYVSMTALEGLNIDPAEVIDTLIGTLTGMRVQGKQEKPVRTRIARERSPRDAGAPKCKDQIMDAIYKFDEPASVSEIARVIGRTYPHVLKSCRKLVEEEKLKTDESGKKFSAAVD